MGLFFQKPCRFGPADFTFAEEKGTHLGTIGRGKYTFAGRRALGRSSNRQTGPLSHPRRHDQAVFGGSLGPQWARAGLYQGRCPCCPRHALGNAPAKGARSIDNSSSFQAVRISCRGTLFLESNHLSVPSPRLDRTRKKRLVASAIVLWAATAATPQKKLAHAVSAPSASSGKEGSPCVQNGSGVYQDPERILVLARETFYTTVRNSGSTDVHRLWGNRCWVGHSTEKSRASRGNLVHRPMRRRLRTEDLIRVLEHSYAEDPRPRPSTVNLPISLLRRRGTAGKSIMHQGRFRGWMDHILISKCTPSQRL